MPTLSPNRKKEWLILIAVSMLWALVFALSFDQPAELFAKNWPIIVIAFFSAMVANATAVGGGFIFLPLFSFMYDLSAIQSLKLALSTQAFGMTSGALSWPRHLIIWRYALFASLASGLGMVLGTFIWQPSNDLIHVYFGYASIVVGIILIVEALQRKSEDNTAYSISSKTEKAIFFMICLGGGLITAWVSIGIGEIVAMWMLFRARYSIASSVATGVVVLALCSLLGFAFHITLGGIAWEYLAFTSIGVMFGGRAGAKLGAVLSSNHSAQKTPQQKRDKFVEATTIKQFTADRPLKIFVALVILLDGIVVLLLK